MMKWFRRHRTGEQGVNGKEIVELTETQRRQLEEWDKVKKEVSRVAPLADYERAEKRRLEDS